MNAAQAVLPSPLSFPPTVRGRVCGTSAMAEMVRRTDWSLTALGDLALWPESLVATVNLVLSSPIPASVYWGPRHVLLYNDGYRQFLAHRHPESLGQCGAEVWKEAWHIVGPQIEHTYRTAEAFYGAGSLVPIERDGRLIDHYWDYSFSPIYDARTGRVAGIYNTCTDVTGAVLTARERDSLAGRLNEMLETTSESVILIDRGWKFTYLNRAGEEFARPLGDLVGRNKWEVFPSLGRDTEHGRRCVRAMEHGESSEFESYYPAPIDRWRHVQARPAADGIALFARDITEEKRAAAALKASNEALAESEEELRWTISLSSQMPWTADVEGNILKHGGNLASLTGRTNEETLGDNWTKMIHPDDLERMAENWNVCVRTGRIHDIEFRIRTTTGEARWFRGRAYPRLDGEGRIVKWYGITDDIDEQKRAVDSLKSLHDALVASEEELSWMVRLTGKHWTASSDGRITWISERWFDKVGISEEQDHGNSWAVAQHPDDIDNFTECWTRSVLSGEPFDIEHRTRLRSGEYCWMRTRAFPRRNERGMILKWYGTTQDIQAQKTAEEAVRTSEKLAAVGRLATSIAHEINNPLEAVTNLLYLAGTSEGLPEIQAYVKSAEEELHRASVIANQTLRFQRQSSAPIALYSDDLIENCLTVFQGKLQNTSVVAERRLRALQPVTCYDGEIRQVFLNLVGNAIDAMQPTGGRLLVRTREATHPLSGKRGLVLTVADTGHGMPSEVCKKLFEPFFTTKGIGGTGLGLWVTKDIVARHHGVLRFRSRPGRRKTDLDAKGKSQSGTVFTLFLPFDAAVRHAPREPLPEGRDAVAA